MSRTIPSTDPPLSLLVESGQFKPFYSPNDMLTLGVFGGSFWYRIPQRDAWLFKSTDFSFGVSLNLYSSVIYDNAVNYFGVDGFLGNDRTFGLPPNQKRLHPKGWFEWYCNYYYGQKSTADAGRIRQWAYAINVEWSYIDGATPTPYMGSGNRATDLNFLQERRQRLLEMGWDPVKDPKDYQLQIKF